MRFFYNNLLDASGVTFAGSSNKTTLPYSNVAHQLRQRVYSTNDLADTNCCISWDLGAAQSPTSFIVCQHTNHNVGFVGSLLAGTGPMITTYPGVGTTTMLSPTITTGTFGGTFSALSRRYWSWQFYKLSGAAEATIGRLFLGTYADTVEQPDFDGWDSDPKDLSTQQRSRGGQIYSDIRSSFRTLRLDFSKIGETDKATIEAVATACGTHTSFFVQVDPSNSPLTEFLYVNFKSRPKFKVSAFDSELKYDTILELEEQL